MKDTIIFINHILDNIGKVEEFSKNLSKEMLSKNELREYAILRAIELIGEAVKNIPETIKNKNPSVSWKDIIGTRDLLIHHYFGVDMNIVWNIIKKDLPMLKQQVLNIKKELEKEK
ncbi:DUF86 domain-containing protein [Candidatus Woesearchaeota archaeon]|nr:DUF86 domain-containing protein [Candidatus Woesearchaeota archaeon]